MKNLLVLFLIVTTLAFTGCTSRATALPAMPTMTSEPTQAKVEPTSTAVSAQEPTASTSEEKIEIKGFAFNPEKVSIKVGTTVEWKNLDSAAHTVTAEDGSWKSGKMAQGDTFKHTFDKAGTFTYICDFHQAMKATIIVE